MNGLTVGNSTERVLSPFTLEDDTWECTVTPNDGFDDGELAIKSVTVMEEGDCCGDSGDTGG